MGRKLIYQICRRLFRALFWYLARCLAALPVIPRGRASRYLASLFFLSNRGLVISEKPFGEIPGFAAHLRVFPAP